MISQTHARYVGPGNREQRGLPRLRVAGAALPHGCTGILFTTAGE